MPRFQLISNVLGGTAHSLCYLRASLLLSGMAFCCPAHAAKFCAQLYKVRNKTKEAGHTNLRIAGQP